MSEDSCGTDSPVVGQFFWTVPIGNPLRLPAAMRRRLLGRRRLRRRFLWGVKAGGVPERSGGGGSGTRSGRKRFRNPIWELKLGCVQQGELRVERGNQECSDPLTECLFRVFKSQTPSDRRETSGRPNGVFDRFWISSAGNPINRRWAEWGRRKRYRTTGCYLHRRGSHGSRIR